MVIFVLSIGHLEFKRKKKTFTMLFTNFLNLNTILYPLSLYLNNLEDKF